jgi:hypothetical protein
MQVHPQQTAAVTGENKDIVLLCCHSRLCYMRVMPVCSMVGVAVIEYRTVGIDCHSGAAPRWHHW